MVNLPQPNMDNPAVRDPDLIAIERAARLPNIDYSIALVYNRSKASTPEGHHKFTGTHVKNYE